MTTETTAAPRTDWGEWLRRYDAQQESYAPTRERRFEVMLELVGMLTSDAPVVLDLGAGPGALSERLLRTFPTARCVALDADPVMLELGRRAWGDLGGRLRWVEADLLEGNWAAAVGEDRVDAVVSSATLHWLRPDDLVGLYRQVARLLPEGSPFLNGDLMLLPPHLTAVQGALDKANGQREAAARASGAEDWGQWWTALRQEPALAEVFAARERTALVERKQQSVVSAAFHELALVEAGFTEAAVVWQDLEEQVLLAIK